MPKRKRTRKAKPIFWLVLGLGLILIIILVQPEQIYFNLRYPNYDSLIEIGYSKERIKSLHESLSESDFLRLAEYKFMEDAELYLEDSLYAQLRDLGYGIPSATKIRTFSDDTLQIILNLEALNEEILNNDYFVEDRLERYLKYQERYPNKDTTTVLRTVNTNRDWLTYNHIEPVDLSKGTLTLVNKYFQLSKEYVPSLVESYDGFLFEASASSSLIELCEEMENLGLDFKISNTYRSYDTQASIYARYLEKDSQNVVDSFSARAGHSEHQLGLALDFRTAKEDITYFENTDAYDWLKENAHIYGFTQRYTEENSIYTGYQAEAWHYRYVGKEMALVLKETQLTLEEALLLGY